MFSYHVTRESLDTVSVLFTMDVYVCMELISRKASARDILCKLMYADDLAVVADSGADLQERLVEWKEIFGRHGLRENLEMMEVLWVGQQKEDLDIRLDGKKLNQQDTFVYLGGAVCRDGGTETEIRRIQTGASAWRKVEEVMGDRCMSWKLKGKVLSSYITPAYLYGLETLAMTEKQQKKLQVCKNNWMRRIAGVKQINKRRNEELKEEVGVRENLTRKLARNRLKWAGHMGRMEGERLGKRADALRVEGRRRRGRLV